MTKLTRPMLFVMSALLALSFTACKKEEPPKVEAAPLTAPTSNDDAAWQAYLVDVIKRNKPADISNPYAYYLPAEGSADYQGFYDRQLEKLQGDLARGVVEGNMLAFGSPSSAKMADMIVTSFTGVDAGSMKGVKVLFIGSPADNERVKAAVAPAGVDYTFVEVK